MGTTPRLLLPYPELADPADVPKDVKALADRLDIVGGGPAVTSLPGSPTDGQECYFIADATNGVVWHLRYRAASPSAFKWECVGWAPLSAGVVASEAVPISTPYVDFTTPGPSVTAPLAGDYIVSFGCLVINGAAAGGSTVVSVAVGATAASDTDAVQAGSTAGVTGLTVTCNRDLLKTCAAGNVLKMQGRAVAVAGNAGRRTISLRPVRVG